MCNRVRLLSLSSVIVVYKKWLYSA